jgi:hypothetical protein
MSVHKKRTAIGCVVLTGFLAVLVLNPVSCALVGMFMGMGHILKSESALRKPRVYEPVGRTLALYCQSDPSLFPQYMGYAWLPEALNAVGHGRLSVREDRAHVEMGGGFHHFGYRLVQDPGTTSPATNAWHLYMYSEGSKDRHLKTFYLDAEHRLSPEDLLKSVVAGYDKQILCSPEDEEAHRGKIQVFLRFDRVTEAREACRSMLKAMPDAWWPVLVNALLLVDKNSLQEAEEIITRWVDRDRNYFRYMDLAYFFQLTGSPGKSAAAMRRSTEYDANTMWGHGGNSEYRGYTAAMYAYQSGEYETVVRLCDHLLEVTINGDYAKRGLRELKDAAVKARQRPDNAPKVKWADGINPFDPFENLDIEKLLQRAVPRMTQKDDGAQRGKHGRDQESPGGYTRLQHVTSCF